MCKIIDLFLNFIFFVMVWIMGSRWWKYFYLRFVGWNVIDRYDKVVFMEFCKWMFYSFDNFMSWLFLVLS